MSSDAIAALSLIQSYNIKLKRGKPINKRYFGKLERGGRKSGGSAKKRPRDLSDKTCDVDEPPTKTRRRESVCSNCGSTQHTALYCPNTRACKESIQNETALDVHERKVLALHHKKMQQCCSMIQINDCEDVSLRKM
jgi:hypothetical protein